MDSSPDPLIIISMDGFRPDFLGRNLTPNIDYLGKKNLLPFWTFISDPKLRSIQQSCKQTDIKVQFDGDEQTDRRTDGRTEGPTDGPTNKQTDGKTDEQTCRRTDRQTDRRTDRRTVRHTIINASYQVIRHLTKRYLGACLKQPPLRQTDRQRTRKNLFIKPSKG